MSVFTGPPVRIGALRRAKLAAAKRDAAAREEAAIVRKDAVERAAALARLGAAAAEEAKEVSRRRNLVEDMLARSVADPVRCENLTKLLTKTMLSLPADGWAGALSLATAVLPVVKRDRQGRCFRVLG